jgi:hypothetical protein
VREIRSGVPDTGKILLSNFYGWFERLERGVYGLTDAGAKHCGDGRSTRQSRQNPRRPDLRFAGIGLP